MLAIGPERGWSDRELAMLESREYVGARMGSRILSSPTAVVSAVAIVQEALR
ncbi:MAG: RNA methyltransferase [Akkermansiaceae bacterium]|nr:RNA methyltransferase [Akkermansiaceae bacterium]